MFKAQFSSELVIKKQKSVDPGNILDEEKQKMNQISN